MGIKLIFEDNDNVSSSELLKCCSNGDSIKFSKGSRGIKNTILKNYNSTDTFIVFYDLVPNNPTTILIYDQLIEWIDNYSNIIVIPIICIEYVILQMLLSLDFLQVSDNKKELVDKLLVEFKYNQLSDESKAIIKGLSLEKAYKFLLGSQKMPCMLNCNKKEGNRRDVTSKFYEGDCDCLRIYCKFNSDMKREEKAERLYVNLPVFEVKGSKHKEYLNSLNIELRDVKIEEVLMKLQQFYDNVCTQLNVSQLALAFPESNIGNTVLSSLVDSEIHKVVSTQSMNLF